MKVKVVRALAGLSQIATSSHNSLNKLTLAHLALGSAVNAASPVVSCSSVKQTSQTVITQNRFYLNCELLGILCEKR